MKVLSKVLCGLAMVLGVNGLFAQENKVQLTEKVSIVFPEKPATRDMQGVATLHTLRLADSSANFNVIVTNLEKSNGLTADVLEAAKLEPAFWEQAETAFIASLGADAKLVSKEMKQVGNQEALSMQVTSERNGKKTLFTVYILTEGVFSINVVYTNRSGQASETLRDNFFKSLAIKE